MKTDDESLIYNEAKRLEPMLRTCGMDVEDAMQEARLVLWQYADRMAGRSGAYRRKAIRFSIVDAVRLANGSRQRHPDWAPLSPRLPAPSAPPRDPVLEKRVSRLPTRHARVLRAAFYDEQPMRVYAEAHGRSRQWASLEKVTALAALRRELV